MTTSDGAPAADGTDGRNAVLDRAFLALADPVRRQIVARLSRGPATVNELAAPHAISKQAVSRHIQVLEQAGLVTRTRDAQRRPVHLEPGRLAELTSWIDRLRLVHEQRFRSLDAVLADLDHTLPATDPSPPGTADTSTADTSTADTSTADDSTGDTAVNARPDAAGIPAGPPDPQEEP